MKIMKRIYLSIFAAAALLAGCEEFGPVFTGKYPNPDMQKIYTDEDFGEFTTISEIKDMYSSNGNKPLVVSEKCIIRGQVTTSDQSGNFYKSLYIQDETAGIEVKIGRNGLYNEYKPGQWLYVDCEGLTIGNYNGMINIGYEDPTGEYETGNLEIPYVIDAFIFKGEYADSVKPVVVTESQLHDKVNLGRLVTIENLRYDDHIFILAYVDPNGDKKDYNNNCIFIDEEGPDNYGVTTWACSESKWKEYLNAGNFDAVEAPAGTVANHKNSDGTYNIGSTAYSVSQYFKMGRTHIQVRSSGYARFSDINIPQPVLDGSATVTFTGILTEYKGEAQFTLIDLGGVKKADGSPWYDADNKVME